MDEEPVPWFAYLASLFGYGPEEKYLWLHLLVGGLAVIVALGAVLGFCRETLAVWIANRLAYKLRREVFHKFEEMAVRYHDETPVGQLMTRCSQDIEALQGFITQLTSGFGFHMIMVTMTACMMFSMSWKLTLWAVFPAPFVMLFTALYYRRIIPKWRKYWTRRSSLSNILHGSLNGIRVVKAFAQEEREARRFDGYSSRFRDAGLGVGYMSARFYPFVSFLFQLGMYFVWLVSGYTVLDAAGAGTQSELSPGVVVAFLAYLGMFYA
ncbi:MAG: hypothetical protein GY851_06050, partial [bacterium]|nr:hypothetical protein [bacterium]